MIVAFRSFVGLLLGDGLWSILHTDSDVVRNSLISINCFLIKGEGGRLPIKKKNMDFFFYSIN